MEAFVLLRGDLGDAEARRRNLYLSLVVQLGRNTERKLNIRVTANTGRNMRVLSIQRSMSRPE